MEQAGKSSRKCEFSTASIADTLFVTNLVRRFYKRDGGIYGIGYDHASSLESVADCIRRGVVILGPRSCAGAFIIPWPFNFEVTVAQVFFWCFEDTREVRIFDALLERCKLAGASHVNTASLAPKHAGKQFYAKRGLKLAEYQYLGSINCLQAGT